MLDRKNLLSNEFDTFTSRQNTPDDPQNSQELAVLAIIKRSAALEYKNK